MLAQTKNSHLNLEGSHLQYPFLYFFPLPKLAFMLNWKIQIRIRGSSASKRSPGGMASNFNLSSCVFFWLLGWWVAQVGSLSACGFDLKHNSNKQIKLKSCWMPPLLEASCRRLYKKNRRLESIFCASTRAWWNPIRQRWHHQSWHKPAGKSSGSLRRSLVQVCSSWNSWGSLQNQGSKKCPKIWILKGSFYFRRGSETPFHLRHIAMQSSWTSP